MIRSILFSLIFFKAVLSSAQPITPQVPANMDFSGIELKIDNDAQKLMQAMVTSLTKHPQYFQSKVERANIHFPLIEKILREEGVPEDFKYLVLQESELIGDAVSTSNAVGYWQFKKESAGDVDVIVNSEVDERMHIAASTRGAAKYIKKNNLYLSNWVNALLSYNLGLGGVKLVVDPGDLNATTMKIRVTTHVYILKLLAHKIAFENSLRLSEPQYTLLEYPDCQNKTLKELSQELSVSEEDLFKYNLWLKSRKVPDDKRHSLIVPTTADNYDRLITLVGSQDEKSFAKPSTITVSSTTKVTKENGLKAILAGNGESIESLSKKGGVQKGKFVRYNEIEKTEKIIPGQIYYLQSKKNKAHQDYHIASANESYWDISQKYGIKKSKLLKYNRITKNEKLQPGRVLWIAETRPIIIPVEIKNIEKPVVKKALFPDKVKSDSKTVVTKTQESDVFPEDFYEDEKKISASISKPVNYEQVSLNDSDLNHTVVKGETLYSISKQYGVRIDDLLNWNNLNQKSGLKTGQSLVIKKYEEASVNQKTTKNDNFITYTVKAGDSIYKIAREHNVTIKQLQEWNNKKDYNISTGEQIKIFRN